MYVDMTSLCLSLQFTGLNPDLLIPITVPVPDDAVSKIVIESVKPYNCSVIQNIEIDQCCEKGLHTFLF